MSCRFSDTTSNDSFIIDFTAKKSSMVTSSSSLSISFRCSWSLWHPITVSMAFWRDSCRQAIFLTSIDGCDVTTSQLKSMYSAPETSVESSLTKTFYVSGLWRTIMVPMFMRGLKKVSAFWSVSFRVSALGRLCYRRFLRNSSGKKCFVRLRELPALGRFHCKLNSAKTFPDLLQTSLSTIFT